MQTSIRRLFHSPTFAMGSVKDWTSVSLVALCITFSLSPALVVSTGHGTHVSPTHVHTTSSKHSTSMAPTADAATTLSTASTSGLAGLSVKSTQVSTLTDCTGMPADVVFILDSSLSEGEGAFHEQLDFVANLTRLLDIGPSHTQISVITYSTYANVQFYLDEHSARDSLLKAIANVTSPSGASYTSDALRLARTNSLAANHGRRQHAWPIVVVLTDGQSSESKLTESEAIALKSNTGALVMAVGIGTLEDLDRNELQMIASDTAHVFNVTSPDILFTIEHEIVKEIKCADRRWALPATTPTTTPTTTSTTTTLPATSPTTTELLPACHGTEAADIILFLDASGQGGQQDFHHMVHFARQLIDGFPAVSPRRIQFSVISYGKDYSGDIFFNSFRDKQGVLDHLQTIRINPGGSDLNDALRFAREYAYAPFHGGRSNKPNYAILVTDSVSDNVNDTVLQASTLKQRQRVELMAVGVGSRVDEKELTAVASDPTRDVFLVSDVTQLDSVQDVIRRRICHAINSLSGSTTSTFAGKNDMLIG